MVCLGNMKCKKCGKTMRQVKGVDVGVYDSSLGSVWECPNPDCGHREEMEFFDLKLQQEYGKK